MAEPLTQNDIRNAIKQYLKQDCVVKTYSDSTTYDLIVDGEHYPPKAIFGLAMSKLLEIEVKSTHFSAGLKSPCFTTFGRLRFGIRLNLVRNRNGRFRPRIPSNAQAIQERGKVQ